MDNEEDLIYRANCQKLMHMVGVLYERGYKAIHVAPNFREGTGRWQLLMYNVHDKKEGRLKLVHQWFADLGLPDVKYTEFEKTPCSLTAVELADKFIEDHAEWLNESLKYDNDEKFALWYQALLTKLKEGELVHSNLRSLVGYNQDPIPSCWVIDGVNFSNVAKIMPYNVASLKLPITRSVPYYLKLTKTSVGKLMSHIGIR